MIYTFICQRCDDLPVAVCCRVMGVSTSGFHAWRACPVSNRDWDDAVLTNTIVDVHRASRRVLWVATASRLDADGKALVKALIEGVLLRHEARRWASAS